MNPLDRLTDSLLGIMAICFVVGALVVGTIVSLAMYADHTACKQTAEVTGLRYQWFAFGGCMVEFRPGQWTSLQRYFAIEIPK